MATLISENQALSNPYQLNDEPGPRGAFESRQVNNGLYIRVDMPGVPPGGLKLRKYSDTRTVTFTGKAPIVWNSIDTSERVYGGYVVLDRDPLELNISAEIKKGCLRVFFPNAEGSLHSLSSKKIDNNNNQVRNDDDETASFSFPDDSTGWFDGHVLNDEAPDQETRDFNKFIRRRYEEERIHFQAARPDQVKGVMGGNFVHINPFLLSGTEGVYEHKAVAGDTNGLNNCVIYTRVDMPGLSCRKVINYEGYGGRNVMFEAKGEKESPLDAGGREYLYMGYQKCSCCRCIKIKEEVKDGVYRILFQKIRVEGSFKKKASNLIQYK